MNIRRIPCNAIICLGVCDNDVMLIIIIERGSVEQQHYADKILRATLNNNEKPTEFYLIGFSSASIETLLITQNVTYYLDR